MRRPSSDACDPRHAAALAALLPALLLAGCGGAAPSGPLECSGQAAPGLADHLLIGFAGSDATAALPGFDLRYQYIAGGLADGAGPCASCATGCTSAGQSCANAGGGCAWWGCWQWDQLPPGAFATAFADEGAAAHGLVPMLTYYQLLQGYRQVDATLQEGTPELTVAAADEAFLRRYLADLAFLGRTIGDRAVWLHLEPDLWGYAQHAGGDPHALAAPVRAAGPAECGALEDSVAGLARCMVAIVRAHAPNAKVALHASPWASGFDLASNASASVDAAAEGRKVGAYLLALGAAGTDLVVADLADRDAGFSGRWLDPTDATLPSFTQILAWGRAVADTTGLPLAWWQVPVGNMSLPGGYQAYRDNRLDYLLDHPDRVAAGGAVAIAFGAGDGAQTTPETDGGHLAARTAALASRGGLPLCAP